MPNKKKKRKKYGRNINIYVLANRIYTYTVSTVRTHYMYIRIPMFRNIMYTEALLDTEVHMRTGPVGIKRCKAMMFSWSITFKIRASPM